MLNYRVCGSCLASTAPINAGPGRLREILCAINVTISTINITTIITTSTSPSPVLKSCNDWICGFLGPTQFLSLKRKYQSTQAQQGHKLGVVTSLHVIAVSKKSVNLNQSCNFFACISGSLRFHLTPMACQSCWFQICNTCRTRKFTMGKSRDEHVELVTWWSSHTDPKVAVRLAR